MNYQENIFQQNMEMWQQLNETAMKNMFALLEQNLAQSKVFQEQVQTAVTEAVNNQFDLVLASLKTIEGQMAELNQSFGETAAPKTKKK